MLHRLGHYPPNCDLLHECGRRRRIGPHIADIAVCPLCCHARFDEMLNHARMVSSPVVACSLSVRQRRIGWHPYATNQSLVCRLAEIPNPLVVYLLFARLGTLLLSK